MLKRFKPRYRSLLGVDISPTSVKIIELSCTNDKRCVQGYGYVHLPPNIIDTHTIKDIDALASCIKKCLIQVNPSNPFAALAVPDSTVISKTIQLFDGLDDAELEELALIEADKYLTYPANEVNIDFAMLGSSNQNPNLLDILLVASRAENVNRRVEAIESAGLKAKIVDVESYAVERVGRLLMKDLSIQGRDKIITVINIGSLFIHVFIFDGRKLVYMKEEILGAKNLLDALVQQYGITAEMIYRHDELEIFCSLVEMILLQIIRSLQFFFSTTHYVIDHIFLAGELARLGNLTRLIQEETTIPTTVVNPFKHMDVAENINLETLLSLAPSLIVACGLALRQINDD